MSAYYKCFASLVSIGLISLSLAACTSNQGPLKNGDIRLEAGASTTFKPIEITWWNFPNYQPLDGEVGKFEKQLAAAFSKKHPDIKVRIEMLTFEGGPQKLNVAIASNMAPDVIYDSPGRIIDWGKKKLLAPLNDMISNEVKVDISEALWKQSKVGDNIYMYPINTTPFMMAVNKTVFERIGAVDLLPLQRPDRTWTFAEYEKALKAVRDKAPDVIPSGFYAKSTAGDQGTRAYIANLGLSRFLSEDYSKVAINTEQAGHALDWIVKGTKEKLVVTGAASLAATDANDLFLQGKLAFSINYSAVLRAQNAPLKKVPFEDVLLPYPTADGSKPKLEPYLGGMAVFDNGNPEKIAASKKFIDFIANDPEYGKKSLIQTGGISARNSVVGLYNDAEYKYAETARQFVTDPPTIADGYGEIRALWFHELQRALTLEATGKASLDSFAAKADAAIKKAKAQADK
ncbi:extracellular solute-binding protein [Paenibacillus sp. GD4]|uniref:ABC transporter substrate-binding protein n=1 Tax=Paenibacillus sp. GD4 TaxID=3068890 RepID=UPI00279680DC|nr:extracellular solute-binding protein [Paenibacillus sp. GD4]MDQ1914797.1 extracellular solute-binding protein [Paenibacillus sp. GD4]